MGRKRFGDDTRYAPGAAPRCHVCPGDGALAHLAGREACHWCDDAGDAKHRCDACGEPQPACLCWDQCKGGADRVLPQCACGAAGLLFRRGLVVCAKCEVNWLVARARDRAPAMEEYEVHTAAADLRNRSHELLALQAFAEERDGRNHRRGDMAARAAREIRRELETRLREDLHHASGKTAEDRVRRRARQHGVAL